MKNRGIVRRGVATALLVALVGLAGCSRSGDAKAGQTATPSPTATTPSTPTQPQGANGVTYNVRNWADYADDQAVLTWKQSLEAASASANARKVLPAFRRGFTTQGLRKILPTIKQAWPDGWTVPSEALVDVARSKTTGNRATVVACIWGETASFRTKQGSFVDAKGTRAWLRTVSQLARSGDTWRVSNYAVKGTCSLEEPS